ncbi:MAG: hypothetical protein F4089_13830 [Gammaproteobacteria bacterium]|nr:hypothetical protein [Acidobacteriota bacterium]MXZ37916.1 hypothetical protein [Holophagales bacterium]MYJ76095.1 hypothetical protein [Gammaproteobacteria bacterium]
MQKDLSPKRRIVIAMSGGGGVVMATRKPSGSLASSAGSVLARVFARLHVGEEAEPSSGLVGGPHLDLDAPADRLTIAHQIVNRLWQGAPRHQSAGPPDYDYARSWPWIPTCYQLVEQAFKLLLSIH